MPAGPNFALYPSTPTRITAPAVIGCFDGFPSVEHELKMMMTGHPLESGITCFNEVGSQHAENGIKAHSRASNLTNLPALAVIVKYKRNMRRDMCPEACDSG